MGISKNIPYLGFSSTPAALPNKTTYMDISHSQGFDFLEDNQHLNSDFNKTKEIQ